MACGGASKVDSNAPAAESVEEGAALSSRQHSRKASVPPTGKTLDRDSRRGESYDEDGDEKQDRKSVV